MVVGEGGVEQLPEGAREPYFQRIETVADVVVVAVRAAVAGGDVAAEDEGNAVADAGWSRSPLTFH